MVLCLGPQTTSSVRLILGLVFHFVFFLKYSSRVLLHLVSLNCGMDFEIFFD